MIARTGSSKLESTSNPGFEIGFQDEETARMMPMEAPEPTAAASRDETNTSFRRIWSYPMAQLLCGKPCP